MTQLRSKQIKLVSRGDIIVGNNSAIGSILALGTNGQILKSNGTSLIYATNNASGVTNDSSVTGITVADALNSLRTSILSLGGG